MAVVNTNDVLDRIVALLKTYMSSDEELGGIGTANTRPIQTVEKGWPVPDAIPIGQMPCIVVSYVGEEDDDEYTGVQAVREHIAVSIIEDLDDHDGALKTVLTYKDEVRTLLFKLNRKLELDGGTALNVVTTIPAGCSCEPVAGEAENQFLLQADVNLVVVRHHDFY